MYEVLLRGRRNLEEPAFTGQEIDEKCVREFRTSGRIIGEIEF